MSSDRDSTFVASREDQIQKIHDLTSSTADVDLIDLTTESQSMTIDLTVEEPKTMENIPKVSSSEQVQCETIQEHQELLSKLPSPFAPASSKQKRKTDCPSGGRTSMTKKGRFMTLKEYKEVASIDQSENAGNGILDTLRGKLLCFFANNFLF